MLKDSSTTHMSGFHFYHVNIFNTISDSSVTFGYTDYM